jgi:uridine phosphorylase
LKGAAADDPAAVARIRAVSSRTSLTAAQLAIAREYGFSSWATLKRAVEDARGVAPLMAGKQRRPSITRSADFLAWAETQGWHPGPLPRGVIFTSASFITNHLQARPDRYRLSTTITPTNGQVFLTADPPVAIACLGPGATAVVNQVEHLAQLGVSLFVVVGPAPAINSAVRPGDCVIAERALRDDGVSQHYLAPARYVAADKALTAALMREAGGLGLRPVRGATWTVPTPYRTTEDELHAYRAEGVLATEMSSAALFAVALALGVRAAGILMISRVLGAASPPRPREDGGRFFVALEAAIRTLRAEARGGDDGHER